MYKVFVNEKKLSISKYPLEVEKRFKYEDLSTLEMAIDLLENTSCPELNVYCEDVSQIWDGFGQLFKIVEAAGGVVTNKNNEVLFIRRLGKWDLAKGKIEPGENMEQAALREIEEETGLKELILKDYLNTTFHIYSERSGTKILKSTYWFTVSYVGSNAPVPQTEEGISEVVWKNKSQIESEVLPMTFENIKLTLENYWNSF